MTPLLLIQYVNLALLVSSIELSTSLPLAQLSHCPLSIVISMAPCQLSPLEMVTSTSSFLLMMPLVSGQSTFSSPRAMQLRHSLLTRQRLKTRLVTPSSACMMTRRVACLPMHSMLNSGPLAFSAASPCEQSLIPMGLLSVPFDPLQMLSLLICMSHIFLAHFGHMLSPLLSIFTTAFLPLPTMASLLSNSCSRRSQTSPSFVSLALLLMFM